jgi:DNA-binding transcriptional regulator LsrR (DeoR family)
MPQMSRGPKQGSEWYKKHSTEAQRNCVIEMYRFSRATSSEIARTVGLSRAQVRLILEKAGLLSKRPSRNS